MENGKKYISGKIFAIVKCAVILLSVLLTVITDRYIVDAETAWLAFDCYMAESCLVSPLILVLFLVFGKFNGKTKAKNTVTKLLFAFMFVVLDFAFFFFFTSIRGMP